MNLIPAVAEKVNRPFSEKWLETTAIIAHNICQFGGDKCAVAFSGGKDSLVVLHIARQYVARIPVVFNNTGVEFPETRAYIRQLSEEWDLNLIVTPYYKKSFWDCVDEYGYPHIRSKKHSKGGSYSPRCCYYLKEMPTKLAIKSYGLKAMFTGQTAVESRMRMFTARDKGICYFHTQYNCQKINPILWWTEDEVWQYIKVKELSCNPLYNEGAPRVGCMPCTSHLHWQGQLARLNPKLLARVMLEKEQQYLMTGLFEK